MKTKEFYGVTFNVYTDAKIEGDFIHPDEAVYFENDVEITGRLEVKHLKCKGSISVHKSYFVREWEEVGECQEVGWYQEVGEYQEVGGYQKVDGDLTAESSRVSLQSTVGGKYEVEGKVSVGVCEWRNTIKEEETLTCGEFVSGDIKYGYLVETGLEKEVESDDKTREAIELLKGRGYKVVKV